MQEEHSRSEQQLLTELAENSKKQLFFARIYACSAFVIAAAVVICLLIIVPRFLSAVNRANEVMAEASDTITQAEEAINSITAMSNAISSMGENFDALITDNAENITAVMEKLDKVDFEGLNSAIKDLGDVVEPLANFFNIFHR